MGIRTAYRIVGSFVRRYRAPGDHGDDFDVGDDVEGSVQSYAGNLSDDDIDELNVLFDARNDRASWPE